MSGAIEAVYIYDEHNRPILSHTFTSRPPTATHLLPLYLAHPPPRPSLIYLPNTSPPTLLFSLSHANLLFFLTSSSEIEPLLALEFLHRVIDVLEEFIGAPLLSSKIEANYDVVAQLLNEMCDAGAINTTEGNALRDVVEVEGWIGKLLGGINLPSKAGGPSSSTTLPGISSSGPTNTPALPWRRANVRHTSNELYVDMVETLQVTLAPSGRPLAAFANGTIAFTCKVSGVPDILLNLSSPSGKHNLESVMELPVFHPCVRLARWREHPGELSFVPPDGRFVLAGYEVDLLPFTSGKLTNSSSNLTLPVNVDVKTSLGPVGADFEVRVQFSTMASYGGNPGLSGASSRPAARLGGSGINPGSSSSPLLEDLVVTVPIPTDVRNLSDIRVSRGDTTYNPGDKVLEWSIPSKEASSGTASMHCTVVGALESEEDDLEGNGFSFNNGNSNSQSGIYEYDENEGHNNGNGAGYQSLPEPKADVVSNAGSKAERDEKRVERNKILMPSSTRVSFAVKGWLASGIKVESLVIDTRKSRGLGEGVKPYKGVKYLCVSNGGVEIRC